MKHIVILTGAGISAESGISTFRDSNGLWENYSVREVATHEAYLENPQLVLDFYNARRDNMLQAMPNEGHLQLVRLEKYYKVSIVTQNVDNLHERAGSKRVLHLHGELDKARSDKNPYTSPEDEKGCISLGARHLHIGDLAADGGQLRPHIVFFGEAVPNYEPAIKLCQEADYCIVIGTSMVVYPAAGLIDYVPSSSPCYLIDPKPVQVRRAVTQIQEKAGTGVKKVVDELIALATRR